MNDQALILIAQHALTPATLKYLSKRAYEIHNNLSSGALLQVRLLDSRVLTYKFPAPRGYGIRGVLVGVYGVGAMAEWIKEDLVSLAVFKSQKS